VGHGKRSRNTVFVEARGGLETTAQNGVRLSSKNTGGNFQKSLGNSSHVFSCNKEGIASQFFSPDPRLCFLKVLISKDFLLNR